MSEWKSLCNKNDIQTGSVKAFDIGGRRIALCRAGENEFYAVQDVCTHDNGPLGEGEMDGFAIECPRHGARFDVRSGKVLALPATAPIHTFPVKVENDIVSISMEAVLKS